MTTTSAAPLESIPHTNRYARLYDEGMSSQIAVRLNETDLAILDAEVASGRATSRSDAVRRSIAYLDRHQAYERDAAILTRLRACGESAYPDLDAIPPADMTGLD